jgi:hypothetical protein
MDLKAIRRNLNYCELIKKSFFNNIKYGLYSYGGIHDYAMDKIPQCRSQGTLLKDQIVEAVSFLASQNAVFIPTETLIKRLRDFIDGWIDYKTLPDDSLKVTINRKSALANQVKVQSQNHHKPVAEGDSIIGQTLIDRTLYVDLKPEIQSTFMVKFKK